VLAAASVREQLAEARLAIEAAAELAGGGGGDSALVIDGKALAHALGPDMRQSLLAVRRPCMRRGPRQQGCSFVCARPVWRQITLLRWGRTCARACWQCAVPASVAA